MTLKLLIAELIPNISTFVSSYLHCPYRVNHDEPANVISWNTMPLVNCPVYFILFLWIIWPECKGIRCNNWYFWNVMLNRIYFLEAYYEINISWKGCGLNPHVLPKNALRLEPEGNVFTNVYLSVHEGSPCDHYPWYIRTHYRGPNLLVMGPQGPTVSDIWWPPQETCSNWFTSAPPTWADIWWLLKCWSTVSAAGGTHLEYFLILACSNNNFENKYWDLCKISVGVDVWKRLLPNKEYCCSRIIRDLIEEFMNEYWRRGLKILQKDITSTRIRKLQLAHVSACTCIFWNNRYFAELCNFLPQVLQY